MATDENDIRPDGGILYGIGVFALVLMLSILGSLFLAYCLGLIYGWFVERDLGPGPSMAGWFGIAELVHLTMATPLLQVQRRESRNTPGAAFGLVVGLALITTFITLAAYITGKIVGWI